MEEINVRREEFPATLDPYVQQGQMFLFNAAQNLIQYGRVLTEAKPLVPRGQFEKWVQTNFNMSERTAQGYMAVWRRFGTNEMLQKVQFSNLQKMLALPDGAESQFAADHDLQAMTAREVERAVKKVRAEAQQAISQERAARQAAERRAEEAEQKQSDPDKSLIAAIAGKDAEIQKYQRSAEAAAQSQRQTMAQLQAARQELQEAEAALAENQQEYDRMQAELLNAQSAIARGDAERAISEQFTADDFSAAVRGFLGSVAQMPYMGETFAQIVDQQEYRKWDSHLQAVEDWAKKARRVLNTAVQGGVIIDG